MKSSLVLIVGDVTNTYLMKQPFCRLVSNNAFISFSFPPFIQIKSNQMLRVHLDSAKPRPTPPLVHTYWMLYALGLNVRTYWMLDALGLNVRTYWMLYALGLNVRTYCMLDVLAVKNST